MMKKLLPLDRIFDKTGNKYLSACVITRRSKQRSENNSLLAEQMNTKVDNRMVVEDTVREFLSDELKYEFSEAKDDE